MYILCFAATLLLTLDTLRRVPIFSVAALYLLYALTCMTLMGAYIATPQFTSRIMYFPRDQISQGSMAAVIIYTAVGALCWAGSFLALGAGTRNLARVSMREQLMALNGNYLKLLAIILSGMLMLHAAEMNWGLAYAANLYLTLNTPSLMGINGFFGSVYHNLMPVILLVAPGLLAASVSKRMPLTSLAFAVHMAYCLVFQIGAHSRWGGVSLLVAAAAIFLVTDGRRVFLSVATASTGVLFYFSALLGRNSGEHGISTIISTFGRFRPELLLDYGMTATYTLVEGIMVTAQASLLGGEHTQVYKTLSFSPLPSVIDGFDKIRSAGQIRLSVVAPIGSWSEAIMFGPIYTGIFGAAALLLISLNSFLIVRRRNILLSMLTISSLAILIYANAYPIRNSFRFILLLAVAHIVMLMIERWSIGHETARRRVGLAERSRFQRTPT